MYNPKPRFDIKQNYQEWLRSRLALFASLAGASASLVGLISFRSVEHKIPFDVTGLTCSIIAKLSAKTLDEREAILEDLDDVSSAARTNAIYLDMSPNMGYQVNTTELPASAVNSAMEMRRAMWLKAKEDLANGQTKYDVVNGWGYAGARYPVGQHEWSKLELEFGSLDTPTLVYPPDNSTK